VTRNDFPGVVVRLNWLSPQAKEPPDKPSAPSKHPETFVFEYFYCFSLDNVTMAMNNMLLAQLMKDMQDPEMMREAQQMMQDPAFQAQMKKMMGSNGFQKAMTKTKKEMQDPEKVKDMEKKAKQAIEEGNEELEKLEKIRKEQAEKAALESKDKGPEEKADGDDRTDDKPAATEEDEVPDIPSLNLN
jgi:cobalamin biosynthesis protein CobT